MSRHEQPPTDVAMLRELDVIDRALAGEPVGGPDAALAELAMTVRSLRDEPAPDYARALDARAAAGFRREPTAGSPGERPAGFRRGRIGAGGAIGRLLGGARRWSPLPTGLRSAATRPWAGAAAAAVVALAIGITVWASGSARHSRPVPAGPAVTEDLATPAHPGPTTPGSTSGAQAVPQSGAAKGDATRGGSAAAIAPAPPEPAGGSAGESDAARKVERSSSLDVGVAPDAIQSSAQRVFSIVSSLGGHVRQSNVTSQSSGSESQGGATFDIRVPTARLSSAIADLSRLGHVRSENDATNDVTGQYDALAAALAHARAERASLLKQLAAATSSAAAEAINARLHGVEARIARTAGSLGALRSRLVFTPLALSLTPERGAAGAGAGSLTPGAAADSAAEILQTAFAVLLIGLAAALPVGLALLGGRMLMVAGRRRVREQALDAS